MWRGGRIRTPGPREGSTDFESAPFGRSGTSPWRGTIQVGSAPPALLCRSSWADASPCQSVPCPPGVAGDPVQGDCKGRPAQSDAAGPFSPTGIGSCRHGDAPKTTVRRGGFRRSAGRYADSGPSSSPLLFAGRASGERVTTPLRPASQPGRVTISRCGYRRGPPQLRGGGCRPRGGRGEGCRAGSSARGHAQLSGLGQGVLSPSTGHPRPRFGDTPERHRPTSLYSRI